MSHPDPAVYNSLPLEQTGPLKADRGQLLLGAFVSPLLPGIGHLTSKRSAKGALLLVIFGALLFAILRLRLEADPGMLLTLAFAMIGLCIYATWDAAYGHGHGTERISQRWLAVLLPFALISAAGHMNWSTRVAGFQLFEIPSESMQNGIMMGDRILVDRRYYDKNPPQDGEIAILVNRQGLFVIKRIIALGGDTIEGREGKVFLNGKLLNEPYVSHSGPMPLEQREFGPLRVPAGKMFVMGDNRDTSLDSRSPQMGSLDVTFLRGKALYTLRSSKHIAFRPLK